MNQDLVKTFRKKLRSLNISDYHGLKSPGLTCYLNCILQVLFMTEDFREAVKQCSRKDSTTFDSHLADLFAALEKEMAKTHEIVKKLGITNVFEQRDAAEYLEIILCKTSREASKMFKGELNHRTKCLKCKETNDSRSFFWMLPLVVEDSRHQIFSVEEGLKAFFKGEKVCGENKIFCSHCKKKQDEEFECTLTRGPGVLTLLLKRFSYDYVCRRYIKLHCKVGIPKTLHMTNCTYHLYAVVDHLGELTGGHYTAQIKSFETQCWYSFNDESVKVKPAKDECLKSHTAYLLMYRKEKLDRAQRAHGRLKDEHIPNVNGEISTGIHGDALKKWTNSSQSLEYRFHQRAQHEEAIQRDGSQKGPELNRRHIDVNAGILSGRPTSYFKNRHEADSETKRSTAAKTKTRGADVGLTGIRVQPAESEAKNKAEEDNSQKTAATETEF